jgi:beta-1,4-mannosyl-glycoprotein beta-1,4-N-acetylglucosaminyltransferase
MLLEIRLKELCPVVDRFVLVEATHTHSGKPKRLYYNEVADNEIFAPYKDKIEHVIFEMTPDNDRWVNENAQRNAISQGLKDAGPDDIVIVSDLDEITDHRAIPFIRRSLSPTRLIMKFYYYYFNCRVLKEGWFFAASCRFKDLVNPQKLRLGIDEGYNWNVITNAGWHFSYLTKPENIPIKLEAFAHAEYDKDCYKDVANIKRCIDAGTDILGRPDMKFAIEPLDAPQCVMNNTEKYREFVK